MRDFLNKVNKKHIVIFSFIGILITIVLYTQDRKDIKDTIANHIEADKRNNTLLDNLSITRIDNEIFKITYVLPKISQNQSRISESVFVDFKNLTLISHENKMYSFRNCDNQRKKYIVFLDISGSVKDKIGIDKYISEINNNLYNIFEKTNLTIGDEIYISFIGDNKDSAINYVLVGPVFEGSLSKNTVYKKNTFYINGINFSDDYTKCRQKDTLISSNIQTVLDNTQKVFSEKIERKIKVETYIGDSIKSIKPKIESNRYNKIVYVMFTDGVDRSVPGANDIGFRYCNKPNCGYDFINQTGNDEAYVFWVENSHENKIKLLFDGIKLNLN